MGGLQTEERQRQSQLIQQWKPWKAAGVKTPESKEISKMNAYKHGGYDAEKGFIRKVITESQAILRSQLLL